MENSPETSTPLLLRAPAAVLRGIGALANTVLDSAADFMGHQNHEIDQELRPYRERKSSDID